ncbi:MAG: serine/threonine-protein kinase [Minicystis sp.]
MAIHPGDILAGYRVTRLLGRGGMGEVWAATSDGPDALDDRGVLRPKDVAIKVLLARAAMKPDLVKRFEREAKIASAIKSPYVCQLLEVAEADDGAHLLVFEQLTGESLADRLKREQDLPFSEVGPIIDDVLQGLCAAHAAGVIHRDLKPGNIFLEQTPPAPVSGRYAPPSGGFGTAGGAYSQRAAADDGPEERLERAKVLDFGISKLARREKGEPTLTAFDATLGSFAYMAPEQVRGAARADERADIYAVGAVAFRALSGRLPFEGTTAAVLVAMKLDRQAPSLAEATGERWPAGIERFLERALERKKERRFGTASEAFTAWRSIQPANITRARRTASRSRPPPPPEAPNADISGHTERIVLPPFPGVPPSPAPIAPPAPRGVHPHLGAIGHPIAPRPGPAPIPPVAPRAPAPRQASAPPGIGGARPAFIPPPPRPPMQSYVPIEDNPTEVDGPPTMTVDTFNTDPNLAKRRKTGRPQGA